MKDNEKQIEEMAKIIGNTWLVDLEGDTKDVCEVLDGVDIKGIARELYEKGYRKLLKGSVVLSREEYEKLKYTWITDSDAYKKGCKETAEKFLQLAYDRCLEKSFIKKVEELAKQFGVEIEELL